MHLAPATCSAVRKLCNVNLQQAPECVSLCARGSASARSGGQGDSAVDHLPENPFHARCSPFISHCCHLFGFSVLPWLFRVLSTPAQEPPKNDHPRTLSTPNKATQNPSKSPQQNRGQEAFALAKLCSEPSASGLGPPNQLASWSRGRGPAVHQKNRHFLQPSSMYGFLCETCSARTDARSTVSSRPAPSVGTMTEDLDLSTTCTPRL